MDENPFKDRELVKVDLVRIGICIGKVEELLGSKNQDLGTEMAHLENW